MWVWARVRGAKRPSRAGVGRRGAVTGFLLFLCGTRRGHLGRAATSIPSGVAALVVATEPLSFVLIEAMRRRRMPKGAIFAGLALGLAGLAILVGPGSFLGSERFDLGGLRRPGRGDLLLGGRLALLAGLPASRFAGDGDGRDAALRRRVPRAPGRCRWASSAGSTPRPCRRTPSSRRSISSSSARSSGFTAYLWLLRVDDACRASRRTPTSTRSWPSSWAGPSPASR